MRLFSAYQNPNIISGGRGYFAKNHRGGDRTLLNRNFQFYFSKQPSITRAILQNAQADALSYKASYLPYRLLIKMRKSENLNIF